MLGAGYLSAAGDWLYSNRDWLLSGLGIAAMTALVAFASKLIVLLRNHLSERKLRKDLRPFYSDANIRYSIRNYVPTTFSDATGNRRRLIPYMVHRALVAESSQRFYLILAGTGMGKSTFLINLYLSYARKWSKAERHVRLLPLNHPHALEEVVKMDDRLKRNTILMLDALDEDIELAENYESRMKEIIDAVWRFDRVVITCRTQFFPSEAAELGEIHLPKPGPEKGYYRFVKIYVEPFDVKDIRKYVRKKFSWVSGKDRKAFQIIRKSRSLMSRPMLLSYIDELLDSREDFRYTFQVYEALINWWIERESLSQPKDARVDFRNNMHRFSTQLALHMHRDYKNNGRLVVSSADMKDFADENDIEMTDLELRSRSLLDRNSDGCYQFSHRSFVEYFLARNAYCQDEDSSSKWAGLDQAGWFLSEMRMFDQEIPYMDPVFRKSMESTARALSASLRSIDKFSGWSDVLYVDISAFCFSRNITKKKRITNVLGYMMRNKEKMVLLVGDSGAGKSVLMRKLCLDLLGSAGKSGLLPIYVDLKHWSPNEPWSRENPPTISQLRDFVRETIRSYCAEDFFGLYYEGLYNSGSLYFVFDSFDEVSLPFGRDVEWVVDCISHVISKFICDGNARGVVASRWFGRPSSSYKAGLTLELEPLGDKSILELYKKRLPKLMALRVFEDRRDLVDLSTNPFFASLITSSLLRRGGVASLDQEVIYEDYFQFLLESVQHRLEGYGLSVQEALDRSSILAYEMLCSFGLVAPVRNLDSRIPFSIEELVDVLAYCGLVRVSGEPGRYLAFSHRKFLEYFAARRLSSKGLYENMTSIGSNGLWRGVLVIYCGESSRNCDLLLGGCRC